MRNIFDQYSQPENRLTHALASVLHQDTVLLSSFISVFGPPRPPKAAQLIVIEQSLPGSPDFADGEMLVRGLPDAVIYSDDGWALVLENRINDTLTIEQLRRHWNTVTKCGFTDVHGLAITREEMPDRFDGWHVISWRDVYRWANGLRGESNWARILVDFFNVAESKMVNEGYLTEGTITDFTGISFEPYTYLEGKRVLRLLTGKIRSDKSFMEDLRLDSSSGRTSITNQERIWDTISFLPSDSEGMSFSQFPHCTIALCADVAEAFVTFPNGMRSGLRRKLHGQSFDVFAERHGHASELIARSLMNLRAYRPMVRVVQRRYQSQRSIPMMDGKVDFDLRTVFGDETPHFGPPVK